MLEVPANVYFCECTDAPATPPGLEQPARSPKYCSAESVPRASNVTDESLGSSRITDPIPVRSTGAHQPTGPIERVTNGGRERRADGRARPACKPLRFILRERALCTRLCLRQHKLPNHQ
ncbi:hypothetical protein SKAU_G00389410 [Synaphobranchus kaupii]|uniref:Uncharacterized protein n=1 Tax=Synaphobranchus kaupii TaxID=118154 RepID=A0A9Q1EB63_SYNKA|nr:hypothetical protein SKAU_G00389410 [Synaphobranchus kaupii]